MLDTTLLHISTYIRKKKNRCDCALLNPEGSHVHTSRGNIYRCTHLYLSSERKSERENTHAQGDETILIECLDHIVMRIHAYFSKYIYIFSPFPFAMRVPSYSLLNMNPAPFCDFLTFARKRLLHTPSPAPHRDTGEEWRGGKDPSSKGQSSPTTHCHHYQNNNKYIYIYVYIIQSLVTLIRTTAIRKRKKNEK